MSEAACPPYQSPLLRQVTGAALRPGGLVLTDRALDYCGFSASDVMLDLGCGLGASAGHIVKERGLRAIGLDVSAEMLAEAKSLQQDLPLIQANAQALPLADASLDGVLCECVLSITNDPETVLRECSRVLKPGGRLILSDLYLRGPFTSENILSLAGCLGGAREKYQILALCREAGLELLLWEDHSRLLRELAAQLIWAHGSASAFWGGRAEAIVPKECQARPGYFMLVARRKA